MTQPDPAGSQDPQDPHRASAESPAPSDPYAAASYPVAPPETYADRSAASQEAGAAAVDGVNRGVIPASIGLAVGVIASILGAASLLGLLRPGEGWIWPAVLTFVFPASILARPRALSRTVRTLAIIGVVLGVIGAAMMLIASLRPS
ncbi:hypothetical protein [Microbacterium gorillae]|uniref:hypothetical protein n=1 Tax=Microbacterium gorillae TaxID=1231063 RepID=UPI00058E3D1E|nr:hypothetical protein [Microbacterium gorillae]